MWKIKHQKNKITSEIEQEQNGHLEMFRRPQAIENSRQYLLLRTYILQKTVVGCPKKFAPYNEVSLYSGFFFSYRKSSIIAPPPGGGLFIASPFEGGGA